MSAAQAVLAPDENALATLEVDLSAELRFAAGRVILTEQRLLACEPGTDSWRAWPLTAGLQLRLLEHGGVGTLELHDSAQRLALWRFTLGAHAAALRLVQRFEQQLAHLARVTSGQPGVAIYEDTTER